MSSDEINNLNFQMGEETTQGIVINLANKAVWLEARVHILESAIEKAEKALEFYSKESNYEADCQDIDCSGNGCGVESLITRDCGSNAIEALSEIRRVKEGNHARRTSSLCPTARTDASPDKPA